MNRTENYPLLHVTSSAFAHNDTIPTKYTCDGDDQNPPLDIEDIPAATQSLAIIVDDPDAPRGTWVHWVVWNIAGTQHHIPENFANGVHGLNDFRETKYGGPCPPSGTHRYHFKVYALDCLLHLPPASTKSELESAMHGHILAYGLMIGRYSRKEK